jgi:ABC-type nickel/cobalt efflux system permease component RcnA
MAGLDRDVLLLYIAVYQCCCSSYYRLSPAMQNIGAGIEGTLGFFEIFQNGAKIVCERIAMQCFIGSMTGSGFSFLSRDQKNHNDGHQYNDHHFLSSKHHDRNHTTFPSQGRNSHPSAQQTYYSIYCRIVRNLTSRATGLSKVLNLVQCRRDI